MPQTPALRGLLTRLADALGQCGEDDYVAFVKNALSDSDQALATFLISNELWGGSGSIADQAGFSPGRERSRRMVEQTLIELGDEQMRVGHVNIRTASWVSAFKEWQERGI